VLLPEAAALAAIAVVRLPSGITHFVVLWRRHGPIVQVMDPARGRRWISARRFLQELYVHEATVPADAWREWAASADTRAVFARRLAIDGIHGSAVDRIFDTAAGDPDWRPLAAADAAGRITAGLVRSGGVAHGADASRLFERMYARAIEQQAGGADFLPRRYWTASPVPDATDQVRMRGAVLVTVRGLRSTAGSVSSSGGGPEWSTQARPASLSPELVAALDEPPVRPWNTLLGLVRADGMLGPVLLLAGLALAVVGVIGEALLLRGVFDIGSHLSLGGQRAGAVLALAALVGALLLLEFPIAASALRLGRRLEARLRVTLLEKIPRLGDRYFQSRPTSDMADRSHSIHQIRLLPDLGAQFARSLFELLLTAAAIAWIDPPSARLAAASAAAALALPILIQPVLRERDLRVKTHAGALGRFYLDAFLGLVAVRTHGAEAAMRREHEGLLVEWARAGIGLQRAVVVIEAVQLLTGFGLAAWLLFNRFGRGGEPGAALLIAYWALNLPILGQELAHAAWQYPGHRNVTLRLLEPLGALEQSSVLSPPSSPDSHQSSATSCQSPADGGQSPVTGVSVTFDRVSVRAAGHQILDGVRLTIPDGLHVAIVGPSGAGKSSLVSLLLGWHWPAAGRVLIDGRPLDGAALDRLRRETAWVDPAVHLWNRSLLDNLQYGADDRATNSVGAAIEAADLRGVLERMPDGLQTPLGEGGGSISGGEGQRVRLARAMMRRDARLVILDEPFRGLERHSRRELLERARTLWRRATLLCITHDVGETLSFDRVLVVADGRLVEDGRPAVLAGQADSRYRAMLDAEEMVREGLWTDVGWRGLRLDRGQLSDVPREVRT
jgi:ATP-binding cassette subfamily B protein